MLDLLGFVIKFFLSKSVCFKANKFSTLDRRTY